MSSLIELFRGGGHKSTAKDSSLQPDGFISKPFLPAEREEKQRLQRACAEYLENATGVSYFEFNQFIANIILLLGGTRDGTKSLNQSSATLIIADDKDKTNLSINQEILTYNSPTKALHKTTIFTEGQRDHVLTVLSVSPAIHAEPKKRLDFGHITFQDPSKPNTVDIESDITGETEKFTGSLVYNTIEKSPLELQGIAKRIFGLYQNQGRAIPATAPKS